MIHVLKRARHQGCAVTEKTVGEHREKAATCQSTGKPQERPSLLAPWSGTFSCQNCEGRKQFWSLGPWCFVYGSPRRVIQRPIENCLSTVLSLTPDNFLTHTHGSIYRRRLGTLGRSLDSLCMALSCMIYCPENSRCLSIPRFQLHFLKSGWPAGSTRALSPCARA